MLITLKTLTFLLHTHISLGLPRSFIVCVILAVAVLWIETSLFKQATWLKLISFTFNPLTGRFKMTNPNAQDDYIESSITLTLRLFFLYIYLRRLPVKFLISVESTRSCYQKNIHVRKPGTPRILGLYMTLSHWI